MLLGNDFTVSALLIIAALLPLYIYRKKVFTFYYVKKDIRQFQRELKLFLSEHYPSIAFDYSIFQRVKKEKDFRVQESLIIENLTTQFVQYDYDVPTQKTINPEQLWMTYEQDSVKPLGKTPNDLQRRKDMVLKRDNQKCTRCGTPMTSQNAYMHYVKPLEDGGTFHVENIALACVDCNRILKDNAPKQIKDLNIYALMLKKAIY